MKLATKKILHNILAMVVSVCMVCTLTPSVAWAAGGADDSSKSDDVVMNAWESEGGNTATGNTKVKAKVYDADFKFDSITPDANYNKKDDFVNAVTGSNPLQAVFHESALPDSYTVTWYIQEMIENPSYDSNQPESKDNPKTILSGDATEIASDTYTKASTPTYDGVPATFTYPGSANVLVPPASLNMSDGKMYEFSVKLVNDADPEQEASATTQVTLLPDYPEIRLYGTGDAVADSNHYMVQGNVYVGFSLPMHYPELNVTPVPGNATDTAFNALQQAAAGNGEEVGSAVSLALTDMDNLPDGNDPYVGQLDVFIPLPDGSGLNVGDSANVYGYNAVAPATTPTAKKYSGEVVEIELEDGTKIPAVAIAVEGTKQALGSFAIGTPMAGSYTVHTSASEGGLINPSGTNGVVSGQPLGKQAEFTALAMTTGYAFAGFEVRVGSATATPVAANQLEVSGNSLKFNPSSIGVADGGNVYVHASFTKVEPPAEGESPTAFTVSATLTTSDGASGDMTFSPAESYSGAPAAKTVRMNQRNVTLDGAVNNYAGIFLSFNPGSDSTVEYVRVNGKDLVFNYWNKQVMIGALDGNTNIEVSYRKLNGEVPPIDTKVNVTGMLDTTDWVPGYIRAMLVIDNAPSQTETSHDYPTSIGAMQTIKVMHTTNYVVRATQIDAEGVHTDVTNKVVKGDRQDSLTIYNVTEDVTIVFNYVPKDAEIEGSVGPGGSGQIIVDPTKQASNSRMKTMALRSAARVGETTTIGRETLEVGNRARIIATPADGYELGRIEVNGTNVTQYFKPHYQGSTITHWTMTVYRTETGMIPEGTGKWDLPGWEGLLQDSVVDTVVPIESSVANVTMSFNPKVPTSEAYQTIRTHVEGNGGTITPSFKAEQNTTATVQFFPDDTYKVDAYRVDTGNWVTVGDNRDSLRVDVPVGAYDHDVYVRFKPGSTNGKPNAYTITPQAFTGGTISPGEPVKVYEGDSFNFSILPKAGYTIGMVEENGTTRPDVTLEGEGDIAVNGYTCTVSNVRSDCSLSVRFDKSDSTSPAHVVTAQCIEGNGSVSPSAPFTVANGSNASFTFWPDDGWYVKGVYVKNSSTPETMPEGEASSDRGINLVGSVVDGRMFTLNDIQEDTVLQVAFGQVKPGDPSTPEPPSLNDGDTFTLSPTDNCQLGDGATVSPNLADMTFVKAKNPDGSLVNPPHAASGSDITVIIASGYKLDDEAANGGITIKNGNDDVTKNVSVRPVGDGMYEVTIPAENITPDMKIVVDTAQNKASQGVVSEAKVKVSVSGNGAVSPAGIDGVVNVEAGKSQTFTFVPDAGWKLHRVYVDDATVTVTGNSYAMHNIQGERNLQAVFVPLEEGEQQPVVVTHDVNVVSRSNTSYGSVYPSGVTKVADGASLSVLVKPAPNYKAVAYEGTTQTAGREIPIVGNTIELTNIKADRNVSVYFEPSQAASYYNLSIAAGSGGIASPAGNMLMAAGSTQTISILPDAGKAVKNVWLTRGNATSGASVLSDVHVTTGNKGIIYTTPSMDEKMSVYVEFCNANDPSRPTTPSLPSGDDLRDPEGNTTYHTVTALVAGGGGTVMPSSAKVANGAPVTLTIVPLEGYHLLSAQLDGRTVTPQNGITYRIGSVTADSTFRVVFEKDSSASDLDQYYTVFANAVGDGTTTTSGQKAAGTISPAGPVTVSGGGNQSFTILPDPNCKVSQIVISNAGSGDAPTVVKDFKGSSYTLFGVNKDINFTVYFTALKPGESGTPSVLTHSITATSSLNGSISPSGVRTVDDGGNAMFTFVPWDGYKLSYAIVDGVNVPASYVANNQYTFADVKEDHSIHAVYIGENEQAADFVSMNITSNRNGTVNPSGSVLATRGSDVTIDVVPFLRYEVKDIVVGNKHLKDFLGSSGFTNGTINEADYSWANGKLTIHKVSDQLSSVQVEFGVNESYNPGGSGDEGIPDYEKVDTNVQPAGSGSTSIQPDPIYMEKPGPGATNDQKTMDVTIVPEDGKIADKIVVNYGDGTSDVYDSTTNPSAQDIYEQGYITVDTDRGDVSLDITFRDLTNQEKNDINNGTIVPATYFEVNVGYSNGGTVGPSGVVKVAKGANLTMQMIPSTGYEVASVTVDGSNRTSEVTNTRTFILKDVQANQKVDVAFGFVGAGEDEKIWEFTAEAAGDVSGGVVSPQQNKVRDGSSQVVYFMPKDGYKVGTVTVQRGDAAPETYNDYNSATMTVRNVKSDVKVSAEFVRASEGEPTWTVDAVSMIVEVGAGSGTATPGYSEVPVGSSVDVSLYPEPEWRASYYTMNGKTTYLPGNVSSWPVMPDATDGAENKMVVFFERINGNGADQVVNVQVVRGDDGALHGSASPSQATVAYGGSTTFYLYPDLKDGYTVDYVRFNGVDQAKQGVINAGVSQKQNIGVRSGNVTLQGSVTTATESDEKNLASSGNVFYSAYTVTLDDVVTSGTLEIKYKKIPDGNHMKVETTPHRMTITSMGGGMVSPLGEIVLPEGETVDILTTSFESYYLASVIQTAGNIKTDLTGSVEGRVAKARMGNADCSVEVTFERVGTPGPPVHVSKGTATYNGSPIEFEIGGYVDPDTGDVVPLSVNNQGILCGSDGNPIDFTRGGAYEFYFNPQATGENGRSLVIESAKYDGKDLSVIPGANYLTNVVLNSSGAFDVVFRELAEGETPISPSKGFTVTIFSQGEGSVSPAGPLTRQPGGETGPLALNGNGENFAVSRIVVGYSDDYGQWTEETVPSTEYANGTYNRTGIDRDITITVYFEEFCIVRVEWDNSLGFITPNHAEGSYIYRPVGTAEIPFAVAPYVDSELVSIETGTTAETAAPVDYSDESKYTDQMYSDLGMANPNDPSGISTMSMADTPNVVVQPASTDFAHIYGFNAPLGKTTYVRANFRSTNVGVEHTIHASAVGHGVVEPAGDVTVNHGSTPTFTATAEAGYTVTGLVVDGNRISPRSSYTFDPVTEDHTIVFEFGLPQAGGASSGADRLVRVANSLARTGDLTGPVVGLFLLIAAAGLTVTAVSYIRRNNRRRQRYQQ